MPKRILSGIIVSHNQDKTAKVNVDRRVKHAKYKKIIKKSKKYIVHDEKNEYKIGDNVLIQESRPISKRKKWIVINGNKILKKDKGQSNKSEAKL